MNVDVPTHWLNDFKMQNISGDAYRFHINLLSLSLTNFSDGLIQTGTERMVFGYRPELVEELLSVDLLEKHSDGFLLTKYAETQNSSARIKANLENRREADRLRQAKRRAKLKQETEKELKKIESSPLSRDRHVTVEGKSKGQGREGLGKALDEEEAKTLQNSENEDFSHWEVAKIPETDPLENQSFQASDLRISETSWSGSFEDLPEPTEEERRNVQLAALEN